MELSRINKKMILLCEKSSNLWQKKLSEDKNKSLADCFHELLDSTAKRNAESWRKKEDPRIQIDLKSWSERISMYMSGEARFDLFDESVGSREFAEVVGIGTMGRRYLFDVYYSDINKSSISSITFSKRKARDIAQSLCGVYDLEIRLPNSEEILSGLMDVRYYMPVGLDARHSKQFKVRCKLDLPSRAESKITLRKDNFEYDGYLSLSHSWYTFTMESRSDAFEQRTLSMLVTTDKDGASLSGRYLKTPFDGDDFGMCGTVKMKLCERHEVIIDPHTILSEV